MSKLPSFVILSCVISQLGSFEIDTIEHRRLSRDFISFYSKYFSPSKTAEVTVLTRDREFLQPAILDFCDGLIHDILESDVFFNIVAKHLGKELDVRADPDLEKYINGTFTLDYDFPAGKAIVRRAQPIGRSLAEHVVKRSSDVRKAHIIASPNLENLQSFLNGSYHVSANRRRALHAIFVLGDRDFDLVAVADVLARLWNKFHVLNAVLCFPAMSEKIYVYRPFKRNSSSWGVVDVYEKIRNLDVGEVLNVLENLEEYPLRVKIFYRFPTAVDSIPKNMLGDGLYRDLFGYSGFMGVDGCVLNELAKQMNFRVLAINTKQRSFGKVLSDGRVTGSQGYVVYDLVDLVANGLFVTERQIRDYEYTSVYFYDDLCVIAPKAERVPHWLAIFKCFDWKTWLLLTLMCGILLALWKISAPQSSLNHDLMDVTLILLSAPVKLDPLKGKNNAVLATCMIFNAIIVWTFQGNLVKSFSSASHYADINTLEELDESGLYISTSLSVFDHYEDSELMKSLFDKIVHKYHNSLEQAAYERNVVALDRRRDAKLFTLLYMTDEDVSRLHVSRNSVTSFYMAFMVPRGSPFLLKMDSLLRRFFESGLMEKWYNDFAASVTTHMLFRISTKKDVPKSFSLYDIQSAFIILLVGYLLAIIVFCWEIVPWKGTVGQLLANK